MLRRCVVSSESQLTIREHCAWAIPVFVSQLFHKSQLGTSATGVLFEFIVTSSQRPFCQNLHHSLWACSLLLVQPHVLHQLVSFRWSSS